MPWCAMPWCALPLALALVHATVVDAYFAHTTFTAPDTATLVATLDTVELIDAASPYYGDTITVLVDPGAAYAIGAKCWAVPSTISYLKIQVDEGLCGVEACEHAVFRGECVPYPAGPAAQTSEVNALGVNCHEAAVFTVLDDAYFKLYDIDFANADEACDDFGFYTAEGSEAYPGAILRTSGSGGFSGSQVTFASGFSYGLTGGTVVVGDVNTEGDAVFECIYCSFENNAVFFEVASVSFGGALVIRHLAPQAVVPECLFCAFANNSASRGAAVFVEANNAFDCRDCYFTENAALVAGQAIYLVDPTSMLCDRCCFASNAPGSLNAISQYYDVQDAAAIVKASLLPRAAPTFTCNDCSFDEDYCPFFAADLALDEDPTAFAFSGSAAFDVDDWLLCTQYSDVGSDAGMCASDPAFAPTPKPTTLPGSRFIKFASWVSQPDCKSICFANGLALPCIEDTQDNDDFFDAIDSSAWLSVEYNSFTSSWEASASGCVATFGLDPGPGFGYPWDDGFTFSAAELCTVLDIGPAAWNSVDCTFEHACYCDTGLESIVPSEDFTTFPTEDGTGYPSEDLTGHPSEFGTGYPVEDFTGQPSEDDTGYPSEDSSGAPSAEPSERPSEVPSGAPSAEPSERPSEVPSGAPSHSEAPSLLPTVSFLPTVSYVPSSVPSAPPSSYPTGAPTLSPSRIPSSVPTLTPSALPSGAPSTAPSTAPSGRPSSQPSVSAAPSALPTTRPTLVPSAVPSSSPSARPSPEPSAAPSAHPTRSASGGPSSAPTAQPTANPSTSHPTSTTSAMPSLSPTFVDFVTFTGTGLPLAGTLECGSDAYGDLADGTDKLDQLGEARRRLGHLNTSAPSASPSEAQSLSPTKGGAPTTGSTVELFYKFRSEEEGAYEFNACDILSGFASPVSGIAVLCNGEPYTSGIVYSCRYCGCGTSITVHLEAYTDYVIAVQTEEDTSAGPLPFRLYPVCLLDHVAITTEAEGLVSTGTVCAANFGVRNTTAEFSVDEIVPPERIEGGLFGFSVDLSIDTAVIGVPYAHGLDYSAAQGAFVEVPNSGRAYVYRKGHENATVLSSSAEGFLPEELFGFSVAISNRTMVIGAPGSTIDGDGDGAIYFFAISDGEWQNVFVATPTQLGGLDDDSDGDDGDDDGSGDGSGGRRRTSEDLPDQYGFAVAMTDALMVVGAPGTDRSGEDSGAAYLYTLSYERKNITFINQVFALDGEAGDAFGAAVAVDGNFSVVGAPGAGKGKAYVIEYVAAEQNWLQRQKLVPLDSSAGNGSRFGSSVAMYGSTIFVGAEDYDAAGTKPGSGSVYVFEYNGVTWDKVQRLRAVDEASGKHFGASLTVVDRVALIGAPYDDTNDEASGAVYLYEEGAAGEWQGVAKLVAPDGLAGDRYGHAVALDSGFNLTGLVANQSEARIAAIVGAPFDDEDGTANAGSAYFFHVPKSTVTAAPSSAPSAVGSLQPSPPPLPTAAPSAAPSHAPTGAPTHPPTMVVSEKPSAAASAGPSEAPTVLNETFSPSHLPTGAPSTLPTASLAPSEFSCDAADQSCIDATAVIAGLPGVIGVCSNTTVDASLSQGVNLTYGWSIALVDDPFVVLATGSGQEYTLPPLAPDQRYRLTLGVVDFRASTAQASLIFRTSSVPVPLVFILGAYEKEIEVFDRLEIKSVASFPDCGAASGFAAFLYQWYLESVDEMAGAVAELQGILSSARAPVLEVPPAVLTPGVSYTFGVDVTAISTNGSSSSKATAETVVRVLRTPPRARISGGSRQQAFVGRGLPLQCAADDPDFPERGVSFLWGCSDPVALRLLPPLNVDSVVVVPEGEAANRTFECSCEVTAFDGVSSSAQVSLVVGEAPAIDPPRVFTSIRADGKRPTLREESQGRGQASVVNADSFAAVYAKVEFQNATYTSAVTFLDLFWSIATYGEAVDGQGSSSGNGTSRLRRLISVDDFNALEGTFTAEVIYRSSRWTSSTSCASTWSERQTGGAAPPSLSSRCA